MEIHSIIYLIVILIGLVFTVSFIYGLWKGTQSVRLEPFTQADIPESTNTGVGESRPAPVNQPASGYYPEDGLQPLVLVNNQEWPIVKWGCLATGTISNWVTANHIRRRVYPCEPIVYSSYSDILSGLMNTRQVDCGFVREYLLLQAKPEIQDNVRVLCPGYEEVIFMLSGQFSQIANFRDILITKKEGVKVTVGVLINSMYEFSVILKAHKIPSDLTLTDLPFNVIYLDTQAALLKALAAGTVDAVFCVAHPYETALIDHIRTHETRLVELYPASKFPLPKANGVQPVYNPEDTDLMAQFRKSVHDSLAWMFDYTMPINRQVRLKEPAGGNDIFIMVPGTSVYKTFKIRSLLVCASRLTDPRILNQLTTRLVTQSYSINEAINEWNAKYLETQLALQVANANKAGVSGVVNTRITRATTSKFPHDFQLGNKTSGLLFLYYDYDSFNPANMGTVPKGLAMEPTMRSVLAKLTNKIKIEYVDACPT